MRCLLLCVCGCVVRRIMSELDVLDVVCCACKLLCVLCFKYCCDVCGELRDLMLRCVVVLSCVLCVMCCVVCDVCCGVCDVW